MQRNIWLPSQLPRTFAACERDVRSDKADVRASAVTDLVKHARDAATRPQAIELIASASKDASPKVRAAAAVALADAEATERSDALVAAIDDDDDEVRQLAITALGEIGDERAVPRLLRAAEDERASMRYQATIALARTEAAGDETRVKALLRASSDDDFNVRYIAMRLAEEHFSSGPERLRLRAVALLDDDEADVTIAAALFLAHAGDERGNVIIGRVVRGEIVAQREDEREAVEIAGELNMRDLIPDLERRAFGLARHVRDTCAFHALIALARMRHPRAIASIRKDMESRNPKRREAATVAATRAKLSGSD
jgi:HEAT repeat protein